MIDLNELMKIDDRRERVRIWIEDQMQERGWSQAEMARQITRATGINTYTSAVNQLVKKERNLREDLAAKLVTTLNCDESTLHEIAGIKRSRSLPNDTYAKEITTHLSYLSGEYREVAREMMRMLRKMQNEKDKHAK